MVDGADASLFQTTNGTLQFITAPDYESTSHGPSYSVTVMASDGVNSSVQTIAVTVADVKVGDTLAGTAGADLFTYAPTLGYDGSTGWTASTR